MPKTTTPPMDHGIKTGRRVNPAIDGPRNKTVCFMLSEGEKHALDRLAFCIQLTRSGLLAKIVAPFLLAAEDGKEGKAAEKELLSYLAECRESVQERGDFATETLQKIETSI